MSPFHEHFENQDGETEQILRRFAIYFAEFFALHLGGSELWFADAAPIYFSIGTIPNLK